MYIVYCGCDRILYIDVNYKIIRSKTEIRVTGHVLRNMDDEQGESSFLQLFWDLASVNDAEQLHAAKEVILALKKKQVGAKFENYV